ncbi:MAG: DNA-binding protein [bacterium]|nr:DNA-binding protein [bacterium]
MNYQKTNQSYLIRLNLGEELMQTLTQFCVDKKIKAGFFVGIGAALTAEIGLYILDKKEYEFQKFKAPLEILNLTGNITLIDNKPFLHVHTTLSDKNFKAIGGHVKELIVGPTCEIHLSVFEKKVSRKLDEEIGLKLMDLEK